MPRWVLFDREGMLQLLLLAAWLLDMRHTKRTNFLGGLQSGQGKDPDKLLGMHPMRWLDVCRS